MFNKLIRKFFHIKKAFFPIFFFFENQKECTRIQTNVERDSGFLLFVTHTTTTTTLLLRLNDDDEENKVGKS